MAALVENIFLPGGGFAAHVDQEGQGAVGQVAAHALVYTPDGLQQQARGGAVMHLSPESGFRLIETPFAPLGQQFPMLQLLAQKPTPATAQAMLDQIERDRCQSVVAGLTPRELETLQAFAGDLMPREVAAKLNISLNTVNTYKRKIFDLCRNAWPEQTTFRYHHLRE